VVGSFVNYLGPGSAKMHKPKPSALRLSPRPKPAHEQRLALAAGSVL